MSKRFALQAFLLILSIGLLVSVHAQSSTTGNITGTVRDPQGAAVAKAEVTITDEKTGATRTVTSNDDGFYSAPALPAANYTISTAPQGFKKTNVTGVQLHVAENLTVNLELQVGQVTETVQVSSDSAPVETRSGEVSTLVNEKQVTELPLSGRNYAQLALMVPGVSPVTQSTAGGAFKTGGTGLDSHVDMSVNGNQSNTNMWTVDGVNNMDVGSNATLLVFPSIDSIQEFRVQRNSFSAEYGQAQGAVINLITKGGTNDFHGAVFEFLRNDKLNANNPFVKATTPTPGHPELPPARPELKYNNFGGNFSGPIWKNRAFFFWSEEWRRETRGTVVSGKVPTAAEKAGDFSGTLTSGTVPHFPGTTTPFPGNKIPQNLLSPYGLLLMKLYPDPNSSGNPNWVGAPPQPVDTRQDMLRGDITITSKMNVLVRWINEKWTHGVANGNFWGDSPFPTLSSDWDQPSHSFAVRLTNTLNSTTVNEFQFSKAGNDIFITTSAETQALNDELFKAFPTVFPHPDGTAAPSLFWGPGGYSDLWHEAPWNNGEDLFIWKDDFSKVVSNHDLKFGVLFSTNEKNETNIGSNEMIQIVQTGDHTGHVIADLLLKDVPLTNYNERNQQEFVLGRWRDFEFYGNDTWKISPRVTLNLGLRWSRFAPPFAANDHVSNWIPRLFDGVNPLSGLVRADQPRGGLDRSLRQTYNKGFQPRLGVAWDVYGDGKTALRLGFGGYESRSNVIEDLLRLAGNQPWTTTVDSGWQSGTNTLTGCPTCRSLDTINQGLATATTAAGLAAVDEDFRPPNSWQWNLTVSREVARNTVAEVSYIGNHGLHIWRRGLNFNDVPPERRAAVIAAFQGGITGDALGAITNANRRFPAVGPVAMSQSTGESNYHGLQAQLNRRFTDRLAWGLAYTWGHAISNVPLVSFTSGTTDPFNSDLDKGDADLDRRHMLIVNGVYSLPTFAGRSAAFRHILGDWQLSGIGSWVGGNPITIQVNGIDPHQFGLAAGPSGGLRPNRVQGVDLYLKNGTRWLNPAAFARPPTTQSSFGTLGAGVVRMPSIKSVDFSVAKNWRFSERYGFQFRSEFFNAFNQVNYDAIDANVGSSTFGTLNHARSPREIQFGFKFTF